MSNRHDTAIHTLPLLQHVFLCMHLRAVINHEYSTWTWCLYMTVTNFMSQVYPSIYLFIYLCTGLSIMKISISCKLCLSNFQQNIYLLYYSTEIFIGIWFQAPVSTCNLSVPMTLIVICYLVIALFVVLHFSAGVHLFSLGARLLEVQ